MGIQFTIKFEGNERIDKFMDKFIKKFPNQVDASVKSAAAFGLRAIRKDTPVKTGRARSGWSLKRVVVTVWEIFNPIAYIEALETGTGIFGPSKRPITPKRKKFLHFPIIKGNSIVGWVRTKSVKGFKGFKMVEKNIPKIQKRLFRQLSVRLGRLWRTS